MISICFGREMCVATRVVSPSAIYAPTGDPVKVFSWLVVSSDASATSRSRAYTSALFRLYTAEFSPIVVRILRATRMRHAAKILFLVGSPPRQRKLVCIGTWLLVAGDGELHTFAQGDSGLPVICHGGDPLLRRGGLLVECTEFLPQLADRRHQRVRVEISLDLENKHGQ